MNADMLRRAATACRNARKEMHGRSDWFEWVPQYLDQMADRVDAIEAALSASRVSSVTAPDPKGP